MPARNRMRMRIRRMLHALCSSPPHDVVRRIWSRAARAVDERRRRRADFVRETYALSAQRSTLQAYWPNVDLPLAAQDLMALRETSAHYLDHRFDLLGSGWVTVRHGMRCRGLAGQRYEPGAPVCADPDGHWLQGRINAANLEHSRQVWRLVDRDYTPIDWHLDFKSGYRWSESTWYRDIRFGHVPGADVKVPWELARMQHLPRLAWAHALGAAGVKGFRPAIVYAREFRNQVLDFIATNPPRFGVNWYSSMDVGIRVANWLVAYDWLRATGATWDRTFDVTFADSVEAHGRHIVQNLDWDPTWRGNHYLANIAGLLFVAAYLPRSPTGDAWLAFAVEQLIEEVRRQFAADGSNIEASTSYHRLAAEMVVFGTALVLALGPDRRSALGQYDHRLIDRRPRLRRAPLPRCALPGRRGDSPFPTWYFERLEKMAEFTLHVTKPTGQIHQVGDNDSGRFLNLQPVYARLTTAEAKARFANLAQYDNLSGCANYWVEDHLDHRPLLAMLGGLIDREDFAQFCGPGRIETPLVQDLIGGMKLTPCLRVGRRPGTAEACLGAEERWRKLRQQLAAKHRLCRYVHRIELPDAEIVRDLNQIAYPDFGLFMWRSPRLYLAVRCGPRRQIGPGAHAHNDQLALELSTDGRDLLADPGSCLYTPDPRQRNRYRSVTAHWAPQPIHLREPGRLDLGLFALDDRARAQCLYFGPRGFAGRHQGYGRPVYRIVELEPTAIVVTDYADRAIALREAWPNRSVTQYRERCPFSAGYGIVDTAPTRPGVRTRTFTEDVHFA
ncbi:MAG: heparinase II/III family protein [Pirellulales bacterium]